MENAGFAGSLAEAGQRHSPKWLLRVPLATDAATVHEGTLADPPSPGTEA